MHFAASVVVEGREIEFPKHKNHTLNGINSPLDASNLTKIFSTTAYKIYFPTKKLYVLRFCFQNVRNRKQKLPPISFYTTMLKEKLNIVFEKTLVL